MTEPPDMDAAFAAGAREAEARFDNASRGAFEARAVGAVLRGLGLEGAAGRLRREAEARTDGGEASFPLFHEMFPGCPVRFGVARLYNLHEPATVAFLMGMPANSKILRAFAELADEDPLPEEDAHRGMIFRLPGFPGPGARAILHTYPVPIGAGQAQIAFSVTDRRTGEGRFFALEPLDQFLAALLRTYRPGR